MKEPFGVAVKNGKLMGREVLTVVGSVHKASDEFEDISSHFLHLYSPLYIMLTLCIGRLLNQSCGTVRVGGSITGRCWREHQREAY